MPPIRRTFVVSDVESATTPLPEAPARRRVNALVYPDTTTQVTRYTAFSQWPEMPSSSPRVVEAKRKLAQLQQVQTHEETRWQAISCPSEYLVECHLWHPFIAALHLAFTDHRPLCLSPDMLWLLICQGVASHIHAHAEAFRHRFVSHSGKAVIQVRRDDFLLDYADNPWREVITSFSGQVRQHLGAAQDLFLPQFSTTGDAECLAAEIVLLEGMQGYFDLRLRTLCGIPRITLEGTTEDWRQLKAQAMRFQGWGVDRWLSLLDPLLEQFIAASQGEIDSSFWQSIYKYKNFSGGEAITGWCTAFFPYLCQREGNVTRPNPWFEEGGESLRAMLAGKEIDAGFGYKGLAPRNFPSGLARAPFTWDYLEEEIPMYLYGGFLGIKQEVDTLTLRPQIGWAVGRQEIPASSVVIDDPDDE